MIFSMICIFGLSEFLGELAVTETRQVQCSIAAVILRLSSVLIIILFVLTSMIREINDKGIELILALAIPKYIYLAGKWLGFSIIAVTVAFICTVLLLLYADFQQIVLWSISLICELLIILSFCLFCLFTFSHITTAFFIVMGFYVLARSMDAIQLISSSPIMYSDSLSQKIIILIIDMIDYVLPKLDQFARTEWLVYQTGSYQDMINVVLQTIIYTGLLITATLFDLYRKNY